MRKCHGSHFSHRKFNWQSLTYNAKGRNQFSDRTICKNAVDFHEDTFIYGKISSSNKTDTLLTIEKMSEIKLIIIIQVDRDGSGDHFLNGLPIP